MSNDSNDNEYLVTGDYHNDEFDFDLVKDDVISGEFFDEGSLIMFDRLIARGILIPVGTEPVEDENKNWRS